MKKIKFCMHHIIIDLHVMEKIKVEEIKEKINRIGDQLSAIHSSCFLKYLCVKYNS